MILYPQQDSPSALGIVSGKIAERDRLDRLLYTDPTVDLHEPLFVFCVNISDFALQFVEGVPFRIY